FNPGVDRYFGFLLWMKYGKSFSGEVNAAIIGGVIAIVTMVVSSITTYYTTQRSAMITVRDEMFRKRLEAYNNLHGILNSIIRANINYFRYMRTEEKDRIEKGAAEFATYYDKNTFYLSKKMRKLCHNTKYFLIALVEFINNRDVKWIDHFLKPETMIRHSEIVKSWGEFKESKEFEQEILTSTSIIIAVQEYCFPIIYQMNDELGLPVIEKEIHPLNEER
ncbi:hypothetical protein, partial [Thermoactinomyces daqus]